MRIPNLFYQSQGDWKYPFIMIGWGLSRILVPRRKVKIDNVAFSLSCINWITHLRWFTFKEKEPEVRKFIDEHVGKGDIFFDIGANVGVFSLYAAKKYEDINIYAFEPEYSNLHLLKENIIANKLTEKIKPYSLAVGNIDGLSMLHLHDTRPGSAVHSENPRKMDFTKEGGRVKWQEGIASATLDGICEKLGVVPTKMKIDTDGNEDKVLEGAGKVLAESRLKAIVLEMPNSVETAEKCAAILKKNGFKLSWEDSKKTRNQIWTK